MTRKRPVCALGNAEDGLCWQHDGSWQTRRAAVGGLPCVCTHSSQAAVLVALNKILLSRTEPYDEVRRTARRGRPNPKPFTVRTQRQKVHWASDVTRCRAQVLDVVKASLKQMGGRGEALEAPSSSGCPAPDQAGCLGEPCHKLGTGLPCIATASSRHLCHTADAPGHGGGGRKRSKQGRERVGCLGVESPVSVCHTAACNASCMSAASNASFKSLLLVARPSARADGS
jgi:hypothetical protein